MKNSVLIIGAGAVGCLSALVLAQRGWQVTIVDRGALGGEASWAGGGILFPLLPWDYSDPVNQLALAGAARYPQLCEELRDTTGINPEYQACGMRVLPPFDERTALAWCQAHGLEAELQQGELWLPQVAQVRNPRLMQSLKAKLQMLGVVLYEHTELLPLQAESGNVTGWRSQNGRNFAANAYVLTAGAWSRPLLGAHVLPVELKPMRGQMLLYRLPPNALENILFQDDFYLIPRLDGHILAGSTVEDVGFDKSTTAEAARELAAKAHALLPQLADAPLLRHWSGLRPGSPENQPVIARHPGLDNLYLNTGHFRYGVTMAPESAHRLTELLA
jgi:glycine oxidase